MCQWDLSLKNPNNKIIETTKMDYLKMKKDRMLKMMCTLKIYNKMKIGK